MICWWCNSMTAWLRSVASSILPSSCFSAGHTAHPRIRGRCAHNTSLQHTPIHHTQFLYSRHHDLHILPPPHRCMQYVSHASQSPYTVCNPASITLTHEAPILTVWIQCSVVGQCQRGRVVTTPVQRQHSTSQAHHSTPQRIP